MATNDLRIKLEEMLDTSKEGVSDVIDEIMTSVDSGKEPSDGTILPSMSAEDKVLMLQNMLDNETDWRKKAKIAARIISEKL